MDEKNKKELKILLGIILILVDIGIVYAGFCLTVLVYFFIDIIFFTILTVFFIITLAVFLVFVISGLFSNRFNKKGLIITGSILGTVICFFVGCYLYNGVYKPSITVKQDSFFLEDYFSDPDIIAKLDKESKIDFVMDENLPVADKDSLEVNTSLTELFERLNQAASFQNKNKVEECLSEINKYYEVHSPIYKEEIRNRPFNEMWMNCKDAATARFLIDNDYISDVFDELCISEHFIPKMIEYKDLEYIAKAFDYLKKLDSKKYKDFVKSQCAVDDFYFVFDYSYKRKIINMKDVSIEEKIRLLKNAGFDFSPLDPIYLSPDEREKFYKLVKVDMNQKVLPFDANAIFYARMNDESYEDFLLAHGADIKYRDANGRNILYYAMITRPNVMYQDNLVETKDEINWEMLGWILEGLGDKPYFRTELIERVKKYISLGVDVNNQDKYGWTVLHYASTTPWYRELRKLLLENGADPTIKTKCGRTADDVKKYFPEGWDNPKFWEGE